MKVIFLDIDGVLNCSKTRNPRKLPYVVDKRLLALLKRMLKRTGAKIVLSSTWRIDPVGRFAAKHHGIPVYDYSPDMPKSPRHQEIKRWLRQHPSVTRYAIIDDEANELDDLPLFQPSGKTGLTAKIAKGVELYLNGETDRTIPGNVAKRVFQDIRSRLTRDKR